jgi:hyaluronoglucosaminidase
VALRRLEDAARQILRKEIEVSKRLVTLKSVCQSRDAMNRSATFQRRGIVEGFFGPLWSMAHRKTLFDFGAERGMNTYLYAPKDDPYHRARWRQPYPPSQWRNLVSLIRRARQRSIDFVYGFHPGKGLCFSEDKPIEILLAKAERFFDAGVKTFAVLFDDIPSRLVHARDRKNFQGSLARAQANWLEKIHERQPQGWQAVEWWICPSYYTPDPWLARVFGQFEADFLETLAEYLPRNVACFWTGPSVVSKKIGLPHVRKIAKRIGRRLILWDNYPVNDLSMSGELHIGPLQGRDPRLPRAVYGYLNNPLLQEELSLIPLSTCFDYAREPMGYRPEASWRKIVVERFGARNLIHWRSIRSFCESIQPAKKTRPAPLTSSHRVRFKAACAYIRSHQRQKWAREIKPWHDLMENLFR